MSNTLLSSYDINNEIARATKELHALNADVELLKRLKAAEAGLTQKRAELERLTAALSEAMDREHKARQAKLSEAYKEFQVNDKTPDNHVLGSSFLITYKRKAHDPETHTTRWEDCSAPGFGSLDRAAYDVLIRDYPNVIPSKILRLGASPQAAFEAYFVGLRRGYLHG